MSVPRRDPQQMQDLNPAGTLQQYTLPHLVSLGCEARQWESLRTGPGSVHFSERHNHKVRSQLSAKSLFLINLRRYG